MDLTHHHSPKSPETDTDTETPLQTHLTKALSLTNGSIKPHKHPPIQPSPPPSHHMLLVSYKECLKNHACTLGGLALDGCGEFMPPHHTSTPVSPTSLRCAACGCHRNFHRRDCTHMAPPPQLHWTSSPSPGSTSSGPSPNPSSPASPTPQSFYSTAPHVLLALSTGHSVPLDETHCQPHPTAVAPSGRKRARTKFTADQKEKMQAFAEKLGWKMARGIEEKMLEQFCREAGVKREVFKVWMHNNKSRRDRGNSTRHISYDFNGVGKCETEGNIGDDGTNVFNTTNYDSYDRFQIESKVHVHGSSPSC